MQRVNSEESQGPPADVLKRGNFLPARREHVQPFSRPYEIYGKHSFPNSPRESRCQLDFRETPHCLLRIVLV
jgi:hypothetical protein